MRTPKIWIIDIIEAVDTVKELTTGYDFDKFKSDKRTYLAIWKLVENIGEACSHLLKEYENDYPQIPWRKIKAMRNQLSHTYWSIDFEVVWKVITTEIDQLKSDLLPILEELNNNEQSSSQ